MSEKINTGIHPATTSYYESMTIDEAVQIAAEKVGEWDYDRDPHGYCHERPVLMALLDAVEPRWRDRVEPHGEDAE